MKAIVVTTGRGPAGMAGGAARAAGSDKRRHRSIHVDTSRLNGGPRPGPIAATVTEHRRSSATSCRRSPLGYGTTGLSVGQRVVGLADHRDGTLGVCSHRGSNLSRSRAASTSRGRACRSGPPRGRDCSARHLQAGRASCARRGRAVGTMVTQLARRLARVIAADARPTVRRRRLARRSSSTSTTTRWKTSAASIWCSMSSAATSRSGPQA